MLRNPSSHLSLFLFCAVAVTACSPAGGDSLAPAFLVVEPLALDFQAEEDSETLLVKNQGEKSLEFQVKVAAESGGVEWLHVEPSSGVLQGSDARAVTVKVQNRHLLVPDAYEGKLTIQGTGLDPVVVLVGMQVGQPVLQVEPAEAVDFGDSSLAKSLIIKNVGAGKLYYTIQLPGPWLSTEAVLQKEITSNEPQTVTLAVDRATVPWYGSDKDEIIIVSNGLNDAVHDSTATIDVSVFVAPDCEVDANCIKAGYYCDTSGESGVCTLLKLDGQGCSDASDCASGFCVASFCCESACDGACLTCNSAATPGACVPRPDDTPCDDGEFCTEETSCLDGQCTGGEERDCSSYDTTCSLGECDEDQDTCRPAGTDGEWCVIESVEGKCVPSGEWHPQLGCLQCDPEKSPTEWSLEPSTCLIDGVCYALGNTLPGTCMVCDPAMPYEPSAAPDFTPCEDDGIPCTVDQCVEGQCQHVAQTTGNCDDGNPCTKNDQCVDGECGGQFYSCDDELECTSDTCDGKGGCANLVADGTCLIAGVCYVGNELQPGSLGCTACKPALSKDSWSTVADATSCSDQDSCTLLDHCQDGICVGNPINCDDQLGCTVDSCNPETGICDNVREANSCIIEGTCYKVDEHPAGLDADCLICDPYSAPLAWSAVNDGLPCDDGLACTDSPICEAGLCGQTGPFCDDGNLCTIDDCAPDGSCSNEVVAEGEPCLSDNDECTDDLCSQGECQHPPVAGKCLIAGLCYGNNESHPEHLCAACKVAQSQTEWTAVNDGAECDDGEFCTTDDLCAAGMCNGQPMDCGSTTCRTAWCSEELDKCAFSNVEDGLGCTDNNACTLADACLAGECVGEPKDCSLPKDANPCLAGWCDSESIPVAGECVELPVEDGTSCDDQLYCTVDDFCANGICVGDQRSCPAADCMEAACSEETDQCISQPDPALAGVACDDGNECTKSTVCLPGGVCGDGASTTSEDCVSLLGIESPCLTALCIAGAGCQAALKSDGTDCPLDNAEAKCFEGACIVTECAEPWGDCNETADDGCEQDLSSDDLHCGECGNECTEDEYCEEGWCVFDCGEMKFCAGECVDTTSDAMHCDGCLQACLSDSADVLGACVNSQCFDSSCPANHFNIDLSPHNGCEYPCTLSNGGTEECDDKDNDCDAEVDEDFDFDIDLENCGKCGAICGPLPHTLYDLCVDGKCTIGKCEPNWGDADGDPLTGCEKILVVEKLWVDDSNAGDPLQNGSPGHPFEDISLALDNCDGYEEIHVKAGSYTGPYVVDVPGVTIEGEERDSVIIIGGASQIGIEVTASAVTLRSLTMTQGHTGIRFNGSNGSAVDDVAVSSIGAQDLPAYGISLLNSSGAEITDCLISNIAGAKPWAEKGPGHMGAGIRAEQSPGLMVSGCSILAVYGGEGTSHYTGGHAGGIGAGIYLQSADSAVIVGTTIGSVVGGKGGLKVGTNNSGKGGEGAGVFVDSSTGLQIDNTIIHSVAPGSNALGNYAAYSACLRASGSTGGVLVNNLTCVGSGVERQRGVTVETGVSAPVTLTNSIIANMSHVCLYNNPANSAGMLKASYGNHDGCGNQVHVNSVLLDGCFSLVPGFVDGPNNNFKLTTGSPCIDAGDPESSYCSEPAPNGCRINLGAFGGTGEATAAPQAQDCSCD